MPYFNINYTRIPVRAEFVGVKMVNGKMEDFTEIHDFYEFRAGRANREAFNVYAFFFKFL